MTLQLDDLYDIIVALEEKIEDVKLCLKAVEQGAITLDEEKKSQISSLIKEIEMFPCDEAELPLKLILFNFPVYKDGGDVFKFLWDESTHVSTCLDAPKKMPFEADIPLAAIYFKNNRPFGLIVYI